MKGGKLLWKWTQNKSLNILTHSEWASPSPLTLQGVLGEQTLNFCPYLKLGGVSRNMLWEMEKELLLPPALQIWKGAWKCKPSVRKCKPSVTWVSKKFDITALRDADCHIHLTGLWTLKHLWGFSLDHTASAESSPPAGCAAVLISWLGYSDVTQVQLEGERTWGWTEFSSLSWEGASLLSKEATGWGEGLTCCLSKAPCVGTNFLHYLPPQIYKSALSLLDCPCQKRPWKGWCTAFWHFPRAVFWFLGLKRVLTESTSVCFFNV